MAEQQKPVITSRAFFEAVAWGFLCSVFLVIIPYFATRYFGEAPHQHLLDYSMGLIALLPFVQGLFAGYKTYPYTMSGWKHFYMLFYIYCSDFIASWLFFKEGYICLLMAAPIYMAVIQMGIALGRGICSLRKSNTIRASLVPVAVMLAVFDGAGPAPVYSNAISDTVTINATPEQVWKYMVEYPVNTKPSEYWLWDIGLPMPTQSVAEAQAVGAKRECRFTDGIVFEEKITEIVPNKVLTFDITKQPEHPEIIGHFSLDKGQMYLERNPDGTTSIIATSWYRLYVRPAKYFDWWAEDIVRNVHFRVLGHIKELAEKEAKQPQMAFNAAAN